MHIISAAFMMDGVVDYSTVWMTDEKTTIWLKGSERTIPPTAMFSFLKKYKELRHLKYKYAVDS